MSVRIVVVVSVLLILVSSQIFWFRRARELFRRGPVLNIIPGRGMRRALAWTLTVGLLTLLVIYIGWIGRTHNVTRLTPGAVLLEAPLTWWLFSSVAAFLVLMMFHLPARGLSLLLGLIRRRPGASGDVRRGESGGLLSEPAGSADILSSPSRAFSSSEPLALPGQFLSQPVPMDC